MSEDSASVQAADAVIAKLGLPLPRKPEKCGEPEWPQNVSDLTPEELTQHLTWWKGWTAHTRWHLARIEGNFIAAEEMYRKLTSELTYKSEGDYGTVTALKASVANAPEVLKARKKVLEAKVTVGLVRALLDGYEDKFIAISRELTRRGKDFDEDKRVGRFGS